MAFDVTLYTSNTAPIVANETSMAMFDNAFAGFVSGARFLRPRKLDFQISSGGSEATIVPNGEVVGVLLGVAPYNHCTWYEREYAPGQEPAAPDLCWVQKTANDYPDALPEMYRHKVNVNGQERWKYRIARRTVWALASATNDGLKLDTDNPVILDITSASLYGKSDPRTGSYKWTGLKGFCEHYSTPVVRVNPSMFLIQINLDPNSVQGVVVFRPAMNGNNPQYLTQELWQQVVNAAQSATVAELLKVTEILDYPKGSQQAQPASAGVPPRQVAAPVTEPAPQPAPQPEARQETVVPADVVTPSEVTIGVSSDMLSAAASILSQAQAAAQPAPKPEPKPQPAVFQPANVSEAAKNSIASLMGDLDNL